jgi:signal transduction histidine kinase
VALLRAEIARFTRELRTPLNGVLGFAQLLEQAPDLPPHFRPWVGRILDSGRHLVGVVDDLLDLSSAQGGGLRLTLQPVEPGALLQDTWTMLAQRAQDAGVRLVARWLTGREHTVMADRLRLRQVMTNLLSNAVKYNRPGGQVEVATERSGAQVALRIADTGQGMDASQLERIFRPFERLGPLMPIACIALGHLAGVQAAQAGQGVDHRLLAAHQLGRAASARNSRWRENQATMIAAAKPSTMSSTMVVT